MTKKYMGSQRYNLTKSSTSNKDSRRVSSTKVLTSIYQILRLALILSMI